MRELSTESGMGAAPRGEIGEIVPEGPVMEPSRFSAA